MASAENRFANRVAIVTGAASGIGAATARLLAGEGAIVYCADRDQAGARHTAVEIHGAAAPDFALSLDVTDEKQWEAGIGRVLARSGGMDLLVNSAGISFGAPVSEMALDDWRRVFAVNLDGVFLGMKHATRAMTPKGGCIINVSSASGIRATAGASAYSASKAAVGMLTRVVAKECRDRGLAIRVNAVAPGGVKTPLWTTMPFFQDLVKQHGSEEGAFQAIAGTDAFGRFAEPDEVGNAILYLASDAAAMITGIELVIDAGYVL